MIKIFTTEKDHSIHLLVNELYDSGLKVEINYYSSINLDSLEIKPQDFIILRDPYNTGLDFSQILRSILSKYKAQVLLDSEYMFKYPDYEDKLSQLGIFSKLGLNYPESVETFVDSPIIAKKRISSRNKGNYIIRNHDEFIEFFKLNKKEEFILQKLIDVKHDYRLLFYKKSYLGALERDVSLSEKSRNKFLIKARDSRIHLDAKKLPIKECLRFIDATKADFIGIDIIEDDQQFYFIEANLSPQFERFVRNTGVNVPRIIAEDLNSIIKISLTLS